MARNIPYTDYDMTTAEVGEALGISTKLVNRIELKALSKMRARLSHLGLSFDQLAIHLRHENAFPGHSSNDDVR